MRSRPRPAARPEYEGHGGEIIEFHPIELTPKGRDALAELIRAHPEGVNPNVTLEDALRIARDGPSAEDIAKMRDDV